MATVKSENSQLDIDIRSVAQDAAKEVGSLVELHCFHLTAMNL